VQQLTAASILRAYAHADPPVQLLAAPLAGETDYIPQGFSPAAPLQRTIADLHKFQVPRRLPLLFDILDAAAAQANPAGYLIYTNSDICLNPDFYIAVRSLLNMGFDALIINRRTVGNIDQYASNPHLAAADIGAKHPGFDCFVFPTQWISKFLKTESCIGANWVMRPLLYNLVAFGSRVLIARDMHLTYHYGDDRAAGAAAFNDYTAHNQSQLPHSLAALCRERGQFQKLQAFCIAHGEMLRPTINPPASDRK
jgi:hypothetical protein